ncbi:MAG: TrkA family potassium uptake protein [candidate division KSB1 bacterium]|nr:TrkA family potassium uptake protein [candidate division KSB1 bacterium]
MKSFAVIGLSSFGFYVAKTLSENGHMVMAIDRSKTRIESVKSFVDRAIIVDATDKETLSNLGVADYDGVFVSLGDQMDSSILVTLYLKELEVSNIIAKALTEDHEKILNIIGAHRIVFPERDEAGRIAKTVENHYLLDVIDLGDDTSIIETSPPEEFVGKTLNELDLRNKYNVLVLVVKDLIPEEEVVIPTAGHVIKDSSVLLLLGKNQDLEKIKKMN